MERIEPSNDRQEIVNPSNLKRKRRSFNDPFFPTLPQFNDDVFRTFKNDLLDPSKMLKKIFKNAGVGLAPFMHPFKFGHFKNHNHQNYYDPEFGSNEIDSDYGEDDENINDGQLNSGNVVYLKNFNDVSEKAFRNEIQ